MLNNQSEVFFITSAATSELPGASNLLLFSEKHFSDSRTTQKVTKKDPETLKAVYF